jgi:hypothetical protein
MAPTELTWGGQLNSCDRWIALNASNRSEVSRTRQWKGRIEAAQQRLGKSASDRFHPAMVG